jgi:hypothetical protein
VFGEGVFGGGWQACSARRESCDGSQQSRASGALVRRGRDALGGACRRTPCAGRAVMAHSSPEPPAGVFGGGLVGGGRVRRGGSQAHSVRRESCDGSQQSRACGALVRRGLVGRACRRTPCAGRAVMAHSSPEPPAGVLGGGLVGGGRVRRGGSQAHSVRRESCDGSQQSRACGALVRRGLVGRACRRAPHAGRAVMAHSSPEPAAHWYGEGLWGERAGVLRTQREL